MKRIAVLSLGGTFGSQSDDSGIRLHSHEEGVTDQLLSIKPEWAEKCELKVSYPFTLLSENMIPEDWAKLANELAKKIGEGIDAIVVTHGTDTMAYTLSAMAFMLQPVTVPIVFTGALLPSDAKDSDAYENLWAAITFARKCEYSGVYLVFGNHRGTRDVFWGPRVQSIRAGGKCFESVNNSRIATMDNGKLLKYRDPFKHIKTKNRRVKVDARLDKRIEVFKVYPGFDPVLLEGAIDRGKRCVIIDLYHSGTACARKEHYGLYTIIPAIKKLHDNEIAVLGAGAPFRESEQYHSTSELVVAGLHPLGPMSLEATVVKAMCLLGRGKPANELGKFMNDQIAHEIFLGAT